MWVRSRPIAALAGLLIALAGAPQASGAAAVRRTSIAVAPAAGDVALVSISFPRGHRRPLDSRSLRVVARSVFGDDYLALAAPRSGHPETALLLVADRPTMLASAERVLLGLLSKRALGTPLLRARIDPLTEPASPPSGICVMTAGTEPLASAQLRVIEAAGRAIPGFTPAAAIAGAYDASCGLGSATALRDALTGLRPPAQAQPAA